MPKLPFVRSLPRPRLPHIRAARVRVPYLRLVVIVAALGAVALVGQASYSSSSSNTYVVQPGDSLWAIAQRSGVSVQALAAVNGMRMTDILPIGRHLSIPGHGQATTVSSASTSAGSAASSAGGSSRTFCQTFRSSGGPYGVLPAQLNSSPSRLALRPYFVRWANAYGVSPALLEAIAWQESGWQQGVVSSANAVGIGQLLPSTASFVAGNQLQITVASDNIEMMARYVAYLASHTSGTCEVIAGYYQGLANLSAYGVLGESEPYVASVEALLPRFE